tara:strand:- start:2295 stop:2618 length:324 start_codon:yes stop_codon:yes gene_type:complete
MVYNYYTLVDYPSKGKTFGNYKGRVPSQAAKKIINKLANQNNIHNNTSPDTQLIVIIIRNTKSKKEHKYVGTRIKLANPITVQYPNNKTVNHYFKTVVSDYDKYYSN